MNVIIHNFVRLAIKATIDYKYINLFWPNIHVVGSFRMVQNFSFFYGLFGCCENKNLENQLHEQKFPAIYEHK